MHEYRSELIPLYIPPGVPLYRDDRGTVRVNDSRVLLDIVVGSYKLGYNAEQISGQYTTADVDDVKGVLAYYQAYQMKWTSICGFDRNAETG